MGYNKSNEQHTLTKGVVVITSKQLFWAYQEWAVYIQALKDLLKVGAEGKDTKEANRDVKEAYRAFLVKVGSVEV